MKGKKTRGLPDLNPGERWAIREHYDWLNVLRDDLVEVHLQRRSWYGGWTTRRMFVETPDEAEIERCAKSLLDFERNQRARKESVKKLVGNYPPKKWGKG